MRGSPIRHIAAVSAVAALIGGTLIPSLSSGADASYARSVPLQMSRTITAAEHPTWGPVAGADDLGRVLPDYSTAGTPKTGKYVGVFFLLWHGSNDPRDYKNTFNDQQTLDVNPTAPQNTTTELYPDAGHFAYWGEPLFGYYRSDDYWVMVKQVEMLADTGVDFLAVDASNERSFKPQLNLLMQAIEAVQRAGRAAPQIVVMTHNNSTAVMDEFYATFYAPSAPYRHPTTWFQYKGKPVIMGINPSATVSSFFTVRYTQWPTEAAQTNNGWDWISFDATPRLNYNSAGEKEEVGIGVAANTNSSVAFSYADYYGEAGARGRGYHAGVDDASSAAVNGGAYLQQQWNDAITADPSIVLVDGWNEWAAGNWQNLQRTNKILLYDASSLRYSRDMEPMAGGYGDNFYLELMSNVRKFKGVEPPSPPSAATSISVSGAFSQWDSVTPTYLGYGDVAGDRNHAGTTNQTYVNTTARNVFSKARVARDSTNLYFYVETVNPITASSGGKWMTLFLDTDGNSTNGWRGYDYVVNRTGVGSGTTTLEHNTGGYTWSSVSSSISYQVSGNKLMLAVPRSSIGASTDPLNMKFKWADNWATDGSIMDFYQYGDAAPYGRLNFVYNTSSSLPAYTAEPAAPTPAAATALPDGTYTIEDTDGITEYNDYSAPSKSWQTAVSAPNASGGKIAYLDSNNGSTDWYFINSVSATFDGNGVRWVTRRAPDAVKQAEVFIDGVSYGVVNLNYKVSQDNFVAFQTYGLAPGKHEIEIKCNNVLGQRCYHDAFQYVRGSSSIPDGVAGEDLANSAAVTASSFAQVRYYPVAPTMTRDLDAATEWRPTGTTAQWLQYDFGKTQSFDQVEITPGSTGFAATSYQLQYWNGSAWTSFATGTLGSSTVTNTFTARNESSIRVAFASTSGAPASVAEVRISKGASNVSAGKTATTSTNNLGYEGSKALDGNDTTYWSASSGAMPQTLTVDLGAKSLWAQTKITFYAADTWRYKLEGSNDLSSWALVQDYTPSGFVGQTNIEQPRVQFRYARITIVGVAANWAAIRAFDILGSVISTPTDLAAGKTTIVSSNSPGSGGANAVDGNVSTYWCAATADMPQWISIDLGAAHPVRQVVTTFYGVDHWRYWLQVSNDGTNFRTVANQSTTTAQTYADTAFGTYRYVRIKPMGADANFAAIREIKVLGY